MRQRAHMEANARRRPKQCCLPPSQPYPWLVYFHGKDEKNQTFCTVSDPTKTYSTSIPELGTANLWAVQHGWCLLASSIANVSQLFLWNPCNLQKINLPPLEHKGIGDCILSSSPTAINQVCSVFLVSSSETTSIFYCQLGDKQWTKIDYHEDLMRTLALEGKDSCEDNFLINPVYCNGCLYAESWFEHLLVEIEKLGQDGIKIKSTHVSLPTTPPTAFEFTRTLLESNNELFRIEMLYAQDLVIAIVVHILE